MTRELLPCPPGVAAAPADHPVGHPAAGDEVTVWLCAADGSTTTDEFRLRLDEYDEASGFWTGRVIGRVSAHAWIQQFDLPPGTAIRVADRHVFQVCERG